MGAACKGTGQLADLDGHDNVGPWRVVVVAWRLDEIMGGGGEGYCSPCVCDIHRRTSSASPWPFCMFSPYALQFYSLSLILLLLFLFLGLQAALGGRWAGDVWAQG